MTELGRAACIDTGEGEHFFAADTMDGLEAQMAALVRATYPHIDGTDDAAILDAAIEEDGFSLWEGRVLSKECHESEAAVVLRITETGSIEPRILIHLCRDEESARVLGDALCRADLQDRGMPIDEDESALERILDVAEVVCSYGSLSAALEFEAVPSSPAVA